MPTYDADEHELKHYGIIRRSGRYPWGSGGNTIGARARRGRTFLEMVDDLEAQGMSQVDIAKGFGMTTTQLRSNVTIANNAIRREKQDRAEKLRAKGWSTSAIATEMELNESSVRQLLDPSVKERTMILENTTEMLRDEVAKGGWIGIGAGSEYYISGGISKERLRSAVAILEDEGYEVIRVQVDQGGTSKKTTVKVLCPPGTKYKDVVTTKDQIRELVYVSEDGGRTQLGILPPLPISSDRVAVRYAEDGGDQSDGVIYVRPGVEDVSLGGSRYAQVRIDVDGTHYLKGMAMYKDDLPPGVDLVFNTNKRKSDPKIQEDPIYGAMKPQEDDKDNPFGAVVKRQILTKDKNGNDQVTSVMNILDEEGNWDTWSRKLSSQVLSKQSPKLAEAQLKKVYDKRKAEFDEINSLTNPTVKRHLLQKYSDTVDADAVHLMAAALPRSSYHVILPFNSLKDNEVYAPNFNQGETVALIRYPHGGTFEIPVLTVNNNAKAPKQTIGRAIDAVGINHEVAKRLSGADFDGDFVMVIPNDSGTIKSTPALRQLENFDPQSYKLPSDAPKMKKGTKENEMGVVSNLITDMTIQKASTDEIARAVKHSMVVIDAEKHHLDYKKSERDHGIPALKEKYQGRHPSGQLKGASTLISRASSTQYVNDRRLRRAKEGGPIDKDTGRLVYVETGAMKKKARTKRNGEVVWEEVPVLQKSTKMAETDDARTLLSKNGGTQIERVYANHANKLKALGNQSRKTMVNSPDAHPYSPSANKVFKKEVEKLTADLKLAKMNAPKERQAQVIQNALVAQKKASTPDMDSARLKKVKAQALAEARTRVGYKKHLVPISDRQWEAIQAGAVRKTVLKEILDNSDIDRVKELATPKQKTLMDSGQAARARSLSKQGLTQAEIARILGVSLTTLKRGLADG